MIKIIPISAVFLLFLIFSSAAAADPVRILFDPATRRPVRYSALQNDTRRVMIPVRYLVKPGELRGVWVATVTNLDFPKTNSTIHFQRTYTDLMIKLKKAGFNAVFFQIRPSCDAFYNSAVNPTSRFLCGREGFGFPQFDLLGFMIREAHRQGLQFHAWLNPYRVAGFTSLPKWQYLKTLSPQNFARRNPDAVLAVPVKNGRTLLLDPGRPEVRSHLLATVREIIMRYYPDSIHFDDYFYPYDYTGNADVPTYRKYNRDPRLTLENWRRENVSLMVREISALIRENNRLQKKNIRFGISPFGIWRNRASSAFGSPTRGNEAYSSNFSDARRWIKNNWIDYVVPQLYWKFSHPKAPYAGLADWWADTVAGTRVKLYIGHGAHLAFITSDPDELKNQLLFNSRRPRISGSVFYSSSRIIAPDSQVRRRAVEAVVRDCWRGTLPPAAPRRIPNKPAPAPKKNRFPPCCQVSLPFHAAEESFSALRPQAFLSF